MVKNIAPIIKCDVRGCDTEVTTVSHSTQYGFTELTIEGLVQSGAYGKPGYQKTPLKKAHICRECWPKLMTGEILFKDIEFHSK